MWKCKTTEDNTEDNQSPRDSGKRWTYIPDKELTGASPDLLPSYANRDADTDGVHNGEGGGKEGRSDSQQVENV